MKIRLYMDVPTVLDDYSMLNYEARSKPWTKTKCVKRYTFTVEIPDPYQPDIELPPVVAVEGKGR